MPEPSVRRRWKSAWFIGVGVSVCSLVGMMSMFLTVRFPLLYVVALITAALGTPGLYVEVWAETAIRGNPHGGGTPLGILLVGVPVNAVVYAILTYGCIVFYSRIRRMLLRSTSAPMHDVKLD